VKLSEATAVIRPRRGWEAIDLGVRMVQRDFVALSRRWIVATLPWYVLALCAGHLFGDISYGLVVFWWFKPAFDRVLLDYLSQRLFSKTVENPGPFDLWFLLPFSASAWRQLTYLRFSLVRTFSLPVYQLEGSAKNSSERIRTLVARDYGASAWLTIVFSTLNSTLLIVIISQLGHWLHPSPVVLQDADLLETLFNTEEIYSGVTYWLHLLFFYLITGLFELFFVGAGFAMYLNRRTHLEAWDIELSFRRLSERLSRGTASAILICFAVVSQLVVTQDSVAQQVDETPRQTVEYSLPSNEEARSVAAEIYAGDEFGEHIDDRVWRPKENDEEEAIDTDLFENLGPVMKLFANLIRYLLIAAVLIALTMWIIRERRRLLLRRNPPKDKADSTHVEDTQEEEEFVPDLNVPEVVRTLWAEGKTRESLSYLYRSALSYLVTKHQLLIGDHATEEDCLRLVRSNASLQVSSYFNDITRQWRLLAYGKREPADDVVFELCTRWHQIADAPSSASTGTATSA